MNEKAPANPSRLPSLPRMRLSEKGARRMTIGVLLAPVIVVILLLFMGGLITGFLRSWVTSP